MTRQALILRYASFAVLAVLANLATQRVVLYSGKTSAHFLVAVAAGTIVGLAVKYLLDKRWIFYDLDTGITAQSQKFTLYAGMGVITTAIFWGAETSFWWIWRSDAMRELGAILGLTVGYLVKYRLDRRFVFTGARSRATA